MKVDLDVLDVSELLHGSRKSSPDETQVQISGL